ncbi:MAG: serine/threonine-protein phosphatase, partial [Anaerolineae bacterium]|nr:serine/threonine-protein phosphatase [Anaerolineae bacterium]
MNWLLGLPTRFIASIIQFFSNLGSPFRLLGAIGRSLQSQFKYIANLPGRYLKLPEGGSGSNLLQDMRDSLSFRSDPAIAKRVKVAETAQYSQIHLTDETTKTRTVVHIGTTIGSSSSEINVGTVGSTRLRFTQIDPASNSGSIGLMVVYSREKVLLNGKPASGEMPMNSGAVISVGKQTYSIKLFAWDRTPIVIRVNAGWSTSTGMVRENNEDAIGLYQHQRGYLFALADGVGGAEYGDQMSAFAIHYLLAVFNRNIAYDLNWEAVLGRAYQNINAEIRNFVKRSAFSAGTTLTSVIIKDWEAHIAHVGDSRLYHWRNDILTQITRDHAHREAVIDNTRHANETRTPSPMRDILEKALGKSDTIQPDLMTLRLLPGDKLLLCSDGVSGVVPLEDLGRMVANERVDLLGDSLVRLANDKGTKDNASAVAIEVMREGYVEDIWRAHEKDRIYVGYRSRPLRLNKPEDHLETHHPERTGNWVRVVVALVILIGIVWGISALNTRQQNLAIAALTTTPTPTATLIPPTPTLLPTIAVSSTPLANLTSPTPPDLSITGTPPPLSSASRI